MAPQPSAEAEKIFVEPARWGLATRVAFRFCFCYFTLYCLTNQILAGMLIAVPVRLGASAPIRIMVGWAAVHVFRVQMPLVFTGSGSGDKTSDWVLSFCLVVIALVATAIWSAIDRRRGEYRTLHKWFYVFLRFAVGGQMLGYGMAKVFPLQMPFPQLTRLVEPFGNFSPMGVLWYSVGASPAYEMFVGSAEVLAAVLLFFPRTAMLGALVCLADTIEVFMLNMTYDVPVKLFAFHLILMSLVMLAPEFRRIAGFFFSKQAVAASSLPDLFRTPRANRIAFGVQAVYALVLISFAVYGSRQSGYAFGGRAPKSPLYGIWNIAQENNQWRRVIFDRPSGMSLQKMDDTFVNYQVSVDSKQSTISIKQKDRTDSLKFQRPLPEQLILDGVLDGREIHMKLQLLDRSKLLLISRGFHWIQEYPFNR